MILRTTRNLTRSVLRMLTLLLFTLLVLMALYVSAGRQLVPLLADYKDNLEQRLETELGMPVTIGSLSGEWLRFVPRFVIEDLSIGNNSTLQLQHVSLTPALLESLRQRRLVIASTNIEALDIHFDQQTDGRWVLAGFSSSGVAPDPELLFQLVTRLARLELTDTRIRFTDLDGRLSQFEQAALQLQSDGSQHQARLQAQWQESRQSLQLEAMLQGQTLSQLSGELYLRLPDADYSVFLPANASLPLPIPGAEANSNSLGVESLFLQGELWSSLFNGSLQELTFRGQTSMQLNSRSGDAHTLLALERLGVAGFFMRRRVGNAGWQFYIDDLAFEHEGQLWPSGDFQIELEPGVSALLQAEVIDVGILSRVLRDLPLGAGVQNEIRSFNPRGQLYNLKLTSGFEGGRPSVLNLTTNVRQGGITAHRGVPSFWGVEAYAEFDFDAVAIRGQGFVEVDSSDMSMHLPRLFNDVWDYDRVNGRVGVRIDGGDETTVRLASSVIIAESEIVSGRAQFATEIHRGEENYVDLELKVGALQADISRKTPYLPTAPGAPRSAQTVLSWVNNAVLGGEGAGSGLVYRGRVQRGSVPAERTLQMFFRVADGALKFDPAWPQLDELDGYVSINNGAVDIVAEGGSTLGIQFNASRASVRPNENGSGSWLTVSGHGRGSAAQGLQYLQQTPVTEGVGQYFSSWQAEGDTDIELALSFPLAIENAKPAVSLSFAFENNKLFIPEYQLPLEELSGRLSYTDEQGLLSEALTATVFGEKLTASLQADGLATSGAANQETRSSVLSWSGTTRPQTLINWEGMPAAIKPLLTSMDGEFDYEAELTLPMRISPSAPQWPVLALRSDLVGTQVQLPAPFAKEQEEARGMDIALEFRAEGPRVDLRWRDVMQMNLALAQGIPQSGLIFLGSTADGVRVRRLNPSAPGVELLGSVAHADLGEWRSTLSRMLAQGQLISPGGAGWWSALQGTAEISIGSLQVADEVFDTLNLSAQRMPQAWELTILSEDIAGKMLYPVMLGEPWQVALDYLHIGEPPTEETELAPGDAVAVTEAAAELDLEDLPVVEYELPREDPLASLDPRNFPAMDLSVKQFTLNGADFGEWNFRLASDDSGAVFTNLRVNARGLSIGSEAEPAEFRWIYDGNIHRSVLNAHITAADLAPVLSAYGYAPSLQSSTASFQSRLHWDGSPAYFSALGLNGDVDILINNGRFQQRAGVANSALRLISILNFDALVRRLRFSDDFLRSGLSYDEISGKVSLSNGVVKINDRLQIIGPASLFQLAGDINLAEQTINADLFITLPVSENIPWLGGLAVLNNLINWQLAIGVFLFDRIFGEQVDNLTSAQYRLEGPWETVEPRLYQVFASGS